MNRTTIVGGSLIAMAIAIGLIAITSSASASARTRTGHHYYFGGAYGYAPVVRVRMYAADHYYQRPLVGRSRVSNNLNPDFQFGGAFGQ